ncbi:Bug family tripartite tricarboxylate transporter substrate binding protein [Advenella sp. RU8]|uniref:Bug family tripartite tricarboxylate transporter substrate binding protein n=1 Tax=Advenella sp. RU8 TaxID=3399575 RepID=UPI003AB04BEE
MQKITRRTMLGTLTGMALAIMLPTQTLMAAQTNYPNKSIRMVIPGPPGGATDIITRLISAELSKELGQTVWVDNKPGASATIGNNIVAKSAPDGYTLLLTFTAIVQAPWLYKNIPYDGLKDLVPITQLARSADLFLVHKDLNVNTLEEFIELAHKNPNKYAYGSYGNGTSSHIHGEQFKRVKNLEMMHIPYRGANPALQALLAGDLNAAFIDITTMTAHLDSDKFKVLAVTGSDRLSTLPNVRTFTEMGIEGFTSNGWLGIFAPANTNPEMVSFISKKLDKVMALPAVQQRFKDFGLRQVGNTPEEFKNILLNDYENYGNIIKAANLRID